MSTPIAEILESCNICGNTAGMDFEPDMINLIFLKWTGVDH